jgi:AraC-like DNA-binding protein
MQFSSPQGHDLPDYDPLHIPLGYADNLIAGAAHRYTAKTYGHIFSQWIVEKEFAWWQHDFLTDQEVAVEPVTPLPILTLHFMVKGDIRFQGDGIKEAGEYILFYIPAGIGNQLWLSKGHSRTQHLNMDPTLLEELAEKYETLQSIVDHALRRLPDGLHQLPARMDHAVWKILEELHNCPEDPIERRYYIKSRLLTLLLFYARDMGSHTSPGFTEGGFIFTPDDIDKLYRAKDILDAREGKPLTIKALSLKISLNTGKLKTGFKRLFGATLYQAQQTRRLEKAVGLLRATTRSIKEIATILEFADRNSFSKAFKRQYEITPLEFRKRRQ